jgi:hypothetical protein
MVVNINQSILHLTESTVDDSVTVRVITIVTLVYLPASFVTVCVSTPSRHSSLYRVNNQANTPYSPSSA